MMQRTIPATGELLPVIGVGSWIQFDVPADSPEREKLTQVLTLMNRAGAKMIDSSPMYGRAEQAIGEITGSLPFADSFFYATKVWTTGKESGVTQIGESLKKMGRKVMDLVQVHNMKDFRTHIDTLNDMKQRGLIRYTGVTHYHDSAHADLERIVREKSVDFVQFNYSIMSRNAEKSLLRASADSGVAVIINEPLEKGSLFRIVEGKPLPEWATAIGIRNWASFFLKYILADPAVTCVIPGTSNPTHMKDILQAGIGEMPDSSMRKKMKEYMESL